VGGAFKSIAYHLPLQVSLFFVSRALLPQRRSILSVAATWRERRAAGSASSWGFHNTGNDVLSEQRFPLWRLAPYGRGFEDCCPLLPPCFVKCAGECAPQLPFNEFGVITPCGNLAFRKREDKCLFRIGKVPGSFDAFPRTRSQKQRKKFGSPFPDTTNSAQFWVLPYYFPSFRTSKIENGKIYGGTFVPTFGANSPTIPFLLKK